MGMDAGGGSDLWCEDGCVWSVHLAGAVALSRPVAARGHEVRLPLPSLALLRATRMSARVALRCVVDERGV